MGLSLSAEQQVDFDMIMPFPDETQGSLYLKQLPDIPLLMT